MFLTSKSSDSVPDLHLDGALLTLLLALCGALLCGALLMG